MFDLGDLLEFLFTPTSWKGWIALLVVVGIAVVLAIWLVS